MNSRLLEAVPWLRGGLILIILLFAGAVACSTAPSSNAPAPLPEADVPAQELDEEPAPQGTEGVLMRISRRLEQGDFAGAIALFEEIEPEEAETASIQILKASVLSSAGQLKESRDLISRILVQEPGNLEALFVRAALDGMEGREREQQLTLEEIIRANPSHLAALMELGNLAFRNRSLRTAASYYDRVLEASPEYREALVGRAGVHRYSKELQKAEDLLNRAVKLYPQWAVPYNERARLYRDAGYPNDALRDLDTAKRLDGNNYWICYDRGSVLLDLNRKAEALEEFSRAVALEPDNFLAYVYTAGIKDDMGDLEGAEQDYERLTKLRPDYYFAFEGLGLHKMRKQHWAEAKDAFAAAYSKAPDEISYALLAVFNGMKAGNRQIDTKRFLEPVIRKAERNSPNWYLLRLFYDLIGESDVAQKIDQEQNQDTKARMLFYLALYYDARNNTVLSNRYFLQMHEMGRRPIFEWRYNEWIVADRKLAAR
jgi:tetratricopeptide (TPR) repeat protein